MAHRWNIYRSGGVDQVAIKSGDDLANLHTLDPKLWIALSMPTKGVDLDPRTLELLDTDKDGYVRQPEVLEAVAWLKEVHTDLGSVLSGGDSVKIDKLKPGAVRAGAEQLLANLGKKADSVTLADATNAEKMFVDTVFNGDGVIIAEAGAGEVKETIEAILAAQGSTLDRSGKPGIDKARTEAFYKEVKDLLAWNADASKDGVQPAGDATAAAADAVRAVRAKIDDYFTRCRLAAFDPRNTAALNPADTTLAGLSAKELSSTSADVASLPLARIEPSGVLPLGGALNPAWSDRIAALTTAIAPLTGKRDTLDLKSWTELCGKLAGYETWRSGKPTTKVDGVPLDKLKLFASHEAEVLALIEKDLAVKDKVDAIVAVERLCRYQRDFGTLINNYVNFSAFYSKRNGIFQAGTLYLDARGCNLTFDVVDAAKHGSMSPMSGAYLAYCDCVRAGVDKRSIAAAFTAGDVDNLFVGRNGVFIDKKGLDWQATITKVVDAPISIRQAFWAPYKKFARSLEERVAKRAADAEAESTAKLQATAGSVAEADKTVAAGAAVKPPEKKGIDIGTVAALGVAVGGIGMVVTAVLGGIFGLGLWAPLGILGIMLAISAPSMILAYMKLRRRNLGPLLDANGWAINALTKINVPFGTALTDRQQIPEGANRNLTDPYAEKQKPWKTYIFLITIVVLGVAWYLGALNGFIADNISKKATSCYVLKKTSEKCEKAGLTRAIVDAPKPDPAPAPAAPAPAAPAPAAPAPAAPAPAPAPAPAAGSGSGSAS